MKERVLKISLLEAIDLFESRKWKFFEVDELDRMIRVEVPRGENETYIVEWPYLDDEMKEKYIQALKKAGFIEQEIRYRAGP